jgi:peptidoglycan/xylan/chitin deacetylase (PgdA/CDA1 family)
MPSYTQAKYIAASTLVKTLPLDKFFRKSNKRYVFAYHRVVNENKAQELRMQKSMWISPETFANDLEWMSKHGEIVDLDTILDFTHKNSTPLFSITFDDGWIDNYEIAYPILKQYSIPATIFLVTGAIETGNVFWVEDFLYKIAISSNQVYSNNLFAVLRECANKYEIDLTGWRGDVQSIAETFAEQVKPMQTELRKGILNDIYKALGLNTEPMKNEILNWDQIYEMSNNGIEFGSHTHTHEILKYTTPAKAKKELESSREIISDKLFKPVKYFCYPNARYNQDSPKYVKSAGYTHAFRIHNLPLTKVEDQYLLPRYLLNETVCRNKHYLMCKLLGIPKF